MIIVSGDQKVKRHMSEKCQTSGAADQVQFSQMKPHGPHPLVLGVDVVRVEIDEIGCVYHRMWRSADLHDNAQHVVCCKTFGFDQITDFH